MGRKKGLGVGCDVCIEVTQLLVTNIGPGCSKVDQGRREGERGNVIYRWLSTPVAPAINVSTVMVTFQHCYFQFCFVIVRDSAPTFIFILSYIFSFLLFSFAFAALIPFTFILSFSHFPPSLCRCLPHNNLFSFIILPFRGFHSL